MKLDCVTTEKRCGVAVVGFDRKENPSAFDEKIVIELTHAACTDADRGHVSVAYQLASAARDSFRKKQSRAGRRRNISNVRGLGYVEQ